LGIEINFGSVVYLRELWMFVIKCAVDAKFHLARSVARVGGTLGVVWAGNSFWNSRRRESFGNG
jgi:hypothetical protein